MNDKRKPEQTHTGGIDPAALAGAALAGALTVSAPPGPYAPASMVIGLTLLLVILGYDVDPHRERFQSIAFSAVFGLVCILIIGFPLEVWFADNWLERLKILLKEKPQDKEQTYSSIPPLGILSLWVLLSGAMFMYDRNRVKVKKILSSLAKINWRKKKSRNR
jgi:hypothetical protein